MAEGPESTAAVGEGALDGLLERVRTSERAARRRMVVYTLVPLAVAIVLIVFTGRQVSDANARLQRLREAEQEAQAAYVKARQAADAGAQEVLRLRQRSERLETEIRTLREDLRTVGEKLSRAEAELGRTADLARHVHPITHESLKTAYFRFPDRADADLLRRILDHREAGVSWKEKGEHSLKEGFNSPAFAAFVLRELKRPVGNTRPGETLWEIGNRLWERLPAVRKPENGDLAFYPGGYVMFYFEDERGDAFVLGMTPNGIVALDPDFLKVEGYRRAQ